MKRFRQLILALGVIPGMTAFAQPNAPNGRITGVVQRPDGQPAAGLDVQIVGTYNLNRGPLPQTDSEGKFDVPFDSRGGPPGSGRCLLIRDPEHNLAIAQEITEETGPLELRLVPGITIAGRTESAGHPVTNATAALVFWTGTSGRHLPGLAIGTNTPGKFEIPALPPGRRYGLSVSAPGYGQKYVNAVEAGTQLKRIEVDPIELNPANLKLAGQLFDTDDNPVANTYVSLSGDGQPSVNTRTGADGRFRFEAVCEGSAQLFASAPSQQGNISARGGDTNVIFKLRQASAFSSSPQRKIKGIVTDPEGQPVSGAQVAVFPFPSNRVKTGLNGSFNLSYPSRSSQPGGAPSLVVRDLSRHLAVAQTIPEGVTNLDVQLQPGFSIAGSVQSADGTPLTNAQIGVWFYAARSYGELNEQLVRPDAEGRFKVETLPLDSKFIVYATAKDHGRSQQEIAARSLTNRVELPAFLLQLTDKLVAGQVVDDQDRPVPAARLSVSGQDQPSAFTNSDSKGHFSFKVCEGSIRLFANGPTGGFANLSAQAGETNLILKLSTTGRASTAGRSLRDLAAFGLDSDTAPGKPLVVCLFDAEQAPSRRSARQLAAKYEALRQKGIAAVGIQANVIPVNTWQAWTNSNRVPFPLGRVAKKTTSTRWASSVESLPWLILRRANGTVAAEGFAIDDLDAQVERSAR